MRDAYVTIGDHSNVLGSIVIEKRGGQVRIGSRTHIGGGTLLDCAREISVGDDVLMAFDVLVMDHDSHALDFEDRRHDVREWMRGRKNWDVVPQSGVRIQDKAWIGARVIILKGVTVGTGAVVGAGSVVVANVPDWTAVAGNPARVIRELPRREP
jgi:galactoside O-acetyltransferase